MFSLNMVDYSMSFLLLFTLNLSYSLRFIVVVLVMAHEILVSAQGPLVLGFWVGAWARQLDQFGLSNENFAE